MTQIIQMPLPRAGAKPCAARERRDQARQLVLDALASQNTPHVPVDYADTPDQVERVVRRLQRMCQDGGMIRPRSDLEAVELAQREAFDA